MTKRKDINPIAPFDAESSPLQLQGLGFLRLPDVLRLYPVSRSTWWAGVKAGRFPPPCRLSARTVAWNVREIQKLLESAPTKGNVNHHDKENRK